MRMFLVAMCDIFLLLYLTTLSQNSPHQVSDITFEDYIKLQEQHELAKEEGEGSLAELRAKNLELERLQQEHSKLMEAIALSQSEFDQEKVRSAGLMEQLEGARQAAQQKDAQIWEARRKAEETYKESLFHKSKAEELALKETRLLQQVEELQEKNSGILSAAEKAELAAKQALEMAEQAEISRLQAQEEERLAKEALRRARESEQEALRLAAISEEGIGEALAMAQRAKMRSERVERERTRDQAKLQAVLQPSQRAIQTKIEQKLLPISIRIETKGFFGSKVRDYNLQGLAVSFGNKTAVFQPTAQLGMGKQLEAETMSGLQAKIAEVPARWILVHPRFKDLIGFVIDAPLPSSSALAAGSVYMPTLLAVRNGAGREFSDSLRSVNNEHYLFERDRLSRSSDGALHLEAQGFRGTGDFGELIMQGDQVVDLEGNLVGVASERNLIRPVAPLGEWQAVALGNRI